MIDWLQIHKADEDAHHDKDHAARHALGEDDEIDISGLTGGYSLDDLKTDHPTLSGTELHDPKAHASGHASGEADDVVAVIGDPNSHASRHASGGDDALGAGSLVTAMIAAGEFNVANKLVKLDASADVPDAQIPTLAYSKLNLTGEILMADLAAAIKNAANGLAVLDASADVEQAQIPTLPYSKLNLTGEILMADLAAAIKNAANGIAVLDASADVPLAQIPTPLTGKSIGSADTYTGNNTVNRAIAHGLGVTPKLVLFIRASGNALANFIKSGEIHWEDAGASSSLQFAVTAWDSTNFYVGNATNYVASCNASGNTYHWVAIA